MEVDVSVTSASMHQVQLACKQEHEWAICIVHVYVSAVCVHVVPAETQFFSLCASVSSWLCFCLPFGNVCSALAGYKRKVTFKSQIPLESLIP